MAALEQGVSPGGAANVLLADQAALAKNVFVSFNLDRLLYSDGQEPRLEYTQM